MDPYERSVTPDKAREEAWFSSSAGEQFFPWRPEAAKITLTDIAHTLSQINRWGGHSREPISVAQHSVNVAVCAGLLAEGRFVDRRHLERWGLLHDATEAYMGGDFVSPVKRNIPDLVALEAGIAPVIEARFNLPKGALSDPVVKEADSIVLAWEYRDLMPRIKGEIPEPMKSRLHRCPPSVLVPWPAKEAEARFLRFAENVGLQEWPA